LEPVAGEDWDTPAVIPLDTHVGSGGLLKPHRLQVKSVLNRENTPAGLLLEGNFHLGVAAGCGGVHGGNDLVKMLPHESPR